jgi:hypothetical protein
MPKRYYFRTVLSIGLALAVVAASFAHAGGDAKVPAVKEISVKGLKLEFGKGGALKKPAVIDDADELAKALFGNGPADKGVLESITKQVDFKKQQLVYFRWAGSGQDKIAAVVQMTGAGDQVVFQYTPGLTRDLRQHAKLFAIARGTKWEIKKGK